MLTYYFIYLFSYLFIYLRKTLKYLGKTSDHQLTIAKAGASGIAQVGRALGPRVCLQHHKITNKKKNLQHNSQSWIEAHCTY